MSSIIAISPTFSHDAGAALIVNGKVIFCLEEEKLSAYPSLVTGSQQSQEPVNKKSEQLAVDAVLQLPENPSCSTQSDGKIRVSNDLPFAVTPFPSTADFKDVANGATVRGHSNPNGTERCEFAVVGAGRVFGIEQSSSVVENHTA